MPDKDLNEFKADHSGGDVVKGAEVFDPVVGAGGPVKKRLADKKDAAYAPVKLGAASGVKTPGNETMKESFAALFEDTDLTEDFKSKLVLVFEAAVNEAAIEKTDGIKEALEEEFEAKLDEALTESMNDIVENLDRYLDYAVSEWFEENAIPLETNLRVERADAFMEGLGSLFSQYSMNIDESTLDVVADLEEQLADLRAKANAVINENIELSNEVKQLEAEQVFTEMTEGLTTTQAERLRVLSEKLDISNIHAFESDLGTLKESFFKTKTPYITEEVEESESLTEEAPAKPKRSEYNSVNVLADMITSIRK